LIQVLCDWNIEAALAHAGSSSVYALGAPPNLDGWPLALRDPRDDESILTTLSLRDVALGSSGLSVKGKHILDPRTGLAIEGNLASWCLSASAARADAFSTALMVMNAEEITNLQRTVPEVSGVVLHENRGGLSLRCWGAFETLEFNSELLSLHQTIDAVDIVPAASDGAILNNPLLLKYLNQYVTLVWNNKDKHNGIFKNVSDDWLEFESEKGPTFLVPREAIAYIIILAE
jgi:hypothetical protein